MSSSLTREPVASVLRDLRAYAAVEDPLAGTRVRERQAELGRRVTTEEKYALYGARPPLAVSPEAGELLYVLARARRPALAVEFGASHGISTIYLAAALRDAGTGRLVTTEIEPEKGEATLRNVRAAGLAAVVELRTGDARETLADLGEPVELLFLDGRNDLYLPVLRLLEPQLAPGAVVIADLSVDDPDLQPYLEHVRAEASGLASLHLPIDAGLEVTITR